MLHFGIHRIFCVFPETKNLC